MKDRIIDSLIFGVCFVSAALMITFVYYPIAYWWSGLSFIVIDVEGVLKFWGGAFAIGFILRMTALSDTLAERRWF